MSLCNFPSFSFSFGLPSIIIGLPTLPSFSFSITFAFPPCPLD